MHEGCRLVVAESGGRRLEARVRRAGGDLVIVLEGGEAPHVGCVVLTVGRVSTADAEKTSVSSSVLTLPPHKEEPIARGIAERLARQLGGAVVVTAGIHEDGLDATGIEEWLGLSRELAGRLLDELRGEGPSAGKP